MHQIELITKNVKNILVENVLLFKYCIRPNKHPCPYKRPPTNIPLGVPFLHVFGSWEGFSKNKIGLVYFFCSPSADVVFHSGHATVSDLIERNGR